MSFWKLFTKRENPDTDLDGVTADRAVPTGDPFSYVRDTYRCPQCGRTGEKEIIGHARMIRKLPSGSGQVMELYPVECSCGTTSTFWNDSTQFYESVRREAANLRQSNKWFFLSGRDELPKEAREVMEGQGNVLIL